METFSALLAICAGNSPVSGEFPAQRPVTRSFDVFFDQRPNKRLSKQACGWWFETHSPPLLRHSNDNVISHILQHSFVASCCNSGEQTVENTNQWNNQQHEWLVFVEEVRITQTGSFTSRHDMFQISIASHTYSNLFIRLTHVIQNTCDIDESN